MTSRTTTRSRNYHVQKKRRAEFVEEWRSYQKTAVALEDAVMQETARGTRTGVYVGADGDRPTRTMDGLAHEIDPGVVSTVHRHSWDAMVLVVAGWGWTEIDGQRIDGALARQRSARQKAVRVAALGEPTLRGGAGVPAGQPSERAASKARLDIYIHPGARAGHPPGRDRSGVAVTPTTRERAHEMRHAATLDRRPRTS